MDTISIITATYNSEKTIRSCLESVASQTVLRNVEHIIIDGKSTDNTLSVVSEFTHVTRIISEPDRGIYHAFNKGIIAASGNIIYFLNSDDELATPETLDKVLEQFSDEIDYVHGRILIFDEVTKMVRISEAYRGQSDYRPKHPAFFCRKMLFEHIGLFNECLTIAADSYFMRKVVTMYNGKYLDDVITRFRMGGCSTLERNFLKMAYEDKAIDLLLGENNALTTLEQQNASFRSANVSLKKLVRKAQNRSLFYQEQLVGKTVAIFGFMELSLIVKDILGGIDVGVCCFLTSAAQGVDIVEGIPVLPMQDATAVGINIVINCVEGSHEESVSKMITESLPGVSVISWREL